jgi:hypothetical protein
MRSIRFRRAPIVGAIGLLGPLACGSTPLTTRTVDTPVGQATAYGTPHNTTYRVEAQPERDKMRLIVHEQSECDRYRVKVLQRVVETVKGDKVVHRDPPRNVQVTEGTEGTVPCQERYVRDANIALKVGESIYRIGKPNARGEVWVDLSSRLSQALYGDSKSAPPDAIVMVEDKAAGTVSLGPLESHNARVESLLAEFRDLLSAEQTKQTPDQIARAYELYAQLTELARDDARVRGAAARFLELVYGRKEHEATDRLKRNLEALSKAKVLMSGLPTGTFPPYVYAAVDNGDPSLDALEWARGHAALGLHQHSGLCAGPKASFTWASIDSEAYPRPTRVSLSLLRYAYGDGYSDTLSGLCRRWR